MLLRSCVAPPAQLVGTAELLAAAWTALTSAMAAASGSPGCCLAHSCVWLWVVARFAW